MSLAPASFNSAPDLDLSASRVSLENLLQDPSIDDDYIFLSLSRILTVQKSTLSIEPASPVEISNLYVVKAIKKICQLNKVEHIRFKNCRLKFEWEKLVKEFGIQSVSLDNCGISLDHLYQLSFAEKLESFEISNQEKIDSSSLNNFLINNQTLKRLVLDNVNLNDKDVKNFKSALQKHRSLQTLQLNQNNITVEGATDLIDAALEPTSLKNLHLDHNQIAGEFIPFYHILVREAKPSLTLSLDRNCQITNRPFSDRLTHVLKEANRQPVGNFEDRFPLIEEVPKDEEVSKDEPVMPFDDSGAFCGKESARFSEELASKIWKYFVELQNEIEQASQPSQEILEKIYNFPLKKYREFFFSKLIFNYFNKHDVRGDGNCLFSAIVFLLNQKHSHQLDFVLSSALRKNKTLFASECQNYRTMDQGLLLRRAAVEYMRTHPYDFIDFIDSMGISDSKEETFKKYCQDMRNITAWGGDIEIKAIFDLFAEMGTTFPPLRILDLTKKPSFQNGDFIVPDLLNIQTGSSETPLYMYRAEQSHFIALIKKGSPELMEIDSHHLGPLQFEDTLRKALEQPENSFSDNDSFFHLINELEKNHNHLLRFVISQYLKNNAHDFTEQIAKYKNISRQVLFQQMIEHFKKCHSTTLTSIEMNSSLRITKKIFEMMGEPIIIIDPENLFAAELESSTNHTIICLIPDTEENENQWFPIDPMESEPFLSANLEESARHAKAPIQNNESRESKRRKLSRNTHSPVYPQESLDSFLSDLVNPRTTLSVHSSEDEEKTTLTFVDDKKK